MICLTLAVQSFPGHIVLTSCNRFYSPFAPSTLKVRPRKPHESWFLMYVPICTGYVAYVQRMSQNLRVSTHIGRLVHFVTVNCCTHFVSVSELYLKCQWLNEYQLDLILGGMRLRVCLV